MKTFWASAIAGLCFMVTLIAFFGDSFTVALVALVICIVICAVNKKCSGYPFAIGLIGYGLVDFENVGWFIAIIGAVVLICSISHNEKAKKERYHSSYSSYSSSSSSNTFDLREELQKRFEEEDRIAEEEREHAEERSRQIREEGERMLENFRQQEEEAEERWRRENGLM